MPIKPQPQPQPQPQPPNIKLMLLRYAIIFFTFILIATLLIYFLSSRFQTPKPALNFELTTHQGQLLTSSELVTKPTLVFFGFTQCPTICPTTLQTLTQVLSKLDEAKQPSILFITVDPKNDTATAIKHYLKSFHSKIIGLTGTYKQLEPVYETFQVYLSKTESADFNRSTLNHSGWVYFFDGNQKFIKHVENTLTIDDFVNEIQLSFL